MKKIFYATLLFSMIGLLANDAHAQTVTVIPIADNYIACSGATVTLEVGPQGGVSYYWYTLSSGGSLLASASNSYTVSNVAPPYTVWVEPRVGATTYTRVPITIHPSQSCGGAPVSCAVSGGLVFKEDFSGNDPNPSINPPIKPTGIPEVSGYNYTTVSGEGATLFQWGDYSIRKYTPRGLGWWYPLDDHTYPGDTTRGYLLICDAAASAGQFYTTTLTGLCPGTKLYFSAWLVSLHIPIAANPTNQIFTLEDNTGHIIAKYYTGNIPDAHSQWEQYGFEFTVPAGLSQLTLRIRNNGTGSNGNDFCLDDIEVHFCAPPITMPPLFALDTTLCPGAPITFSASYTDDGTFGNALLYRWEYSSTGNVNNPLEWTPLTGNLSGISPISATYTIPAMDATKVGYYRLALSGSTATLNNPSCRATSSLIHVQLGALPVVNLSASPSSVCVGSPTTLTAALSAGSTTAMTYTWYEGSSAIGTTTVNTYNVSSVPATGNYSVKAVNSYGCEGSDTVAITAIVVVPSVTITATPQ